METLSDIQNLIAQLKTEEDLIPMSRQQELHDLAKDIQDSIQSYGQAKLIFVCTHNSRRSQLSEAWLNVIASEEGNKIIKAFSGGTEATAFHPNMVGALTRAGFTLEIQEPGENPTYHLANSDHRYFSKIYNHPYNPQEHFIAVMVCTQADEDCPWIPGAEKRFALPFEDPKKADDTPEQDATYDAKVREIGRELLLLYHKSFDV